MKVYGSGVLENERADLTGKSYVNLCFEKIQKGLDWLENGDNCQTLPAALEVLFMLAEKFTDDVFVKLKKSDLIAWQSKYNDRYKVNSKKLPPKYRKDIKTNVDKIFNDLQEYANDVSWL